MNLPGVRPDARPAQCGEFESLRVYLRGDTVTWEGERFEALADFRSGYLPPPLIVLDRPGHFWKRVP